MKNWLNRIVNRLTAVGADKWLHILVSLIVAYIVAETAKAGGVNAIGCVIVATPVTMALGVAKEIYDELFRYGFCAEELLWDGLGIAVGLTLFLI